MTFRLKRVWGRQSSCANKSNHLHMIAWLLATAENLVLIQFAWRFSLLLHFYFRSTLNINHLTLFFVFWVFHFIFQRDVLGLCPYPPDLDDSPKDCVLLIQLRLFTKVSMFRMQITGNWLQHFVCMSLKANLVRYVQAVSNIQPWGQSLTVKRRQLIIGIWFLLKIYLYRIQVQSLFLCYLVGQLRERWR